MRDNHAYLMGAGHRRPASNLNIEHPTSNIQHPTSNIQHPTSNIQHPTSNIQHPTSNIQSRIAAESRKQKVERWGKAAQSEVHAWYKPRLSGPGHKSGDVS